jgi:glycosyltransferase involved in cell wall biosynthesis
VLEESSIKTVSVVFTVAGYLDSARYNMIISIITVTLNNAAGLEKTIGSVRAQTCRDYEFIIIDGSSTDNSKEIIESNKDIIHHFISEPDKGIFDAMNKGLNIATGDFVIFLNSGDSFYDKNIIDYVINNITSLDKVYFGCAKIYHNDNTFYLFPKLDITKHELAQFLKYYKPNHQTIFFPKKFYMKNKYNIQYRNASDEEYKIKALIECDYCFFNIIVTSFLSGGTTFPKTIRKVMELIHEQINIHKKYKNYPIHLYIRFSISTIVKYLFYKILKDKVYYVLSWYKNCKAKGVEIS